MPLELPVRRPRLLAAAAFGAAASALTGAWFLPTIIRLQDGIALLLYVGLPGLAAAAAGAVLGAPILDPARVRNPDMAVLRGAVVASAALLLFAPLFATVLTWSAPGRTTILGLTALVLLFSAIAVWWMAALVGAGVGWLLWRVSAGRAG